MKILQISYDYFHNSLKIYISQEDYIILDKIHWAKLFLDGIIIHPIYNKL